MITWRGWGISVLYLLIFWIVLAVGVFVAISPYQPDRLKASFGIQWGLAGIFAVTAASVYALCLYRSRPKTVAGLATGQSMTVQNMDEFMYLPMRFWPYILVAIAAVIAGATLLGYPFFTD